MNLPRPVPSTPVGSSEPLLPSSKGAQPTRSFSQTPDDAGRAGSAPDEAGDLGRLGKYRLRKELGRGSMGVVYLADDERLQRQVALKVMLPEVAASSTARERFLREARAAARISSDHVISVFGADEIDGTPCIAMQYIEGCSLAQHLARQAPLTFSAVMRIGRETALGLAAAHRLGLVHRDIKPGNLWLERGGRVKILDFGLARVQQAETHLTASGAIVGTPAFMAPEQIAGKPEARSDLFSLGVVLYLMLAGHLPFERPDTLSLLMAVATEQPPPLRELGPDVPLPLADLICRLMAKKPAERPADASAVADELAQILAAVGDKPGLSTTIDYVAAAVRKRPRWLAPVWVALALLPLLALGTWLVTRPRAPTLTPARLPAGPIKGSVDLLVYRIDRTGSDVLVPLSHPLALPLRTGDQFKIVAEVDRPAYLYLFWVDENGAGVPVYPWEQGKWDTRPADQQPVRTLELMAPNGKGFAVTGDAKGMETIVMLARSERLSTADAEVQGWFAGLKPLPFRGEQARVWFENFDVLRTDEKRGLKYGGDVAEVDGPRGLQLALKQRVGPVELARAISFARVGPEQ